MSGSAPSVGVVVLTRDRRAGALATLDRLVELPERPEIVLVDDASVDGTARAVARRHPGVRVVRLLRNAGASGRNAGVRALDSDLAALSDDDSWWAPGALSRARDVFATRPGLGLLQARILVGPQGHVDPVCTAMAASPLARRPGLPGPPILGFIACGAVLRKTAFLGSGGFNPRFGIGGEEKLLALDMAAAGWELAYVDSVIAHHHPDTGAQRPGRRARTLRNDLWTTWLRGRLPGAAVDTIRIAARAGRGACGPGLLAALRGLPWVLAARRPLAPALDRAARRV